MIDFVKLLVGLFRSHAAREAEMAFLHQQLVVLKRSAPARLQFHESPPLFPAARHQPDRRSHAFKLRRQIPFVPVSTRRRSSLAALAIAISCRALPTRACSPSRRRSRAAMV
jgi:hypothetical protein